MTSIWSDEMAQRYDFMLPVTTHYSLVALELALRKLGVSSEAEADTKLKVLDVACGTGAFAHVAAEVLPNSEIHATDFSKDMVDIFMTKTNAMGMTDRVSGEVLDGQNLHTIPDNSLDVVGCVFGIMFFSDRSKGWKEIHRVLKPGCSAAVVTWYSADFIQLISQVYKELKPDATIVPVADAALSCADSHAILTELKAAAPFTSAEAVEDKFAFKTSRAAMTNFVKGPLAMMLGPSAGDFDDAQKLAAVDKSMDAHGYFDDFTLNFHAILYIVGK